MTLLYPKRDETLSARDRISIRSLQAASKSSVLKYTQRSWANLGLYSYMIVSSKLKEDRPLFRFQPNCPELLRVRLGPQKRIFGKQNSLPAPQPKSVELAVNLLCTWANSASYPEQDGKSVVAHGLRGKGLVRLIGAVVYLSCCTAIKSFAIASSRWPHNAPRHHQLMHANQLPLPRL